MDWYMDETGDILQSSTGDIGVTGTEWRSTVQQAYIRLMTENGDYTMYPTLGAGLSQLYGMPQTAATGTFGQSLILNALISDNTFTSSQVSVKAVPIDRQSIRFDVTLISGNLQQLTLSLQQNLTLV